MLTKAANACITKAHTVRGVGRTIKPRQPARKTRYDSAHVTTTLPDRDLLARLVAFPSVSGGNDADLVDFVCDYLGTAGVNIERIPSSDGSRCNIIATAGTLRDDRKGLVLCGHLDVVPADEPEWTNDPFTLTERNGKLFGRGSCDMKASVAIAMNQLVKAARRDLNHPLIGVFTFDEELGSLGAQQFTKAMASHAPLPTDCIIGEPTSLQPVRMHKGHLKLRITIIGKAAHSGSPHLGINAIAPAGAIIAKLDALAREFELHHASAASVSIPPPSEGGGKGVGGGSIAQSHAQGSSQTLTHPPTPSLEGRGRAEITRAFRSVPFPVLCVARIRGGEALNVIPERCDIDVGIRLMPGMQSNDAIARVQQIVTESKSDPKVTLTVTNDNPPMLYIPPPSEGGGQGVGEASLLQSLQELTGCADDIGVSYASDAGVLQRDLGMRCVLFGPGTIEVAHRPDEFVPIDELEECSNIIARIVHQWCDA